MHEAFTLTYAGAFQTRELQFYSATYRQVLTGEGLTFFANASYGFGRPELGIELEFLLYRTRSLYARRRAELPDHPRARAQPQRRRRCGSGPTTAARSSTCRTRRRARSTACAAFAFGWTPTPPTRPAPSTSSTSHSARASTGLGSTQNGSDLASRFNGRVDFTKMELTVSRLQPLFDQFSVLVAAYGQYALTPLLVSELCGYGGRLFGRAFDPSQFVSDSCLEVAGRAAVRYSHAIKRTYPGPAVRLRRPWLAPQYCPGSGHIQQRGCCLFGSWVTAGMAERDYR